MKLTFNKHKFKKLSSISFSALLAWLVPMGLVLSVALIIQQLGASINSDPFQLSTLGDVVLLLSWIFSPLVSFALWFVNRKKKNNFISSFFIYTVILFFVSLIPLYVNPAKKTSYAVRIAINNTKIFYIALYIALCIGFVVNLYISKQALKKSNWWLFIVALPYVFTGLMAFHQQQAFIKFMNLKEFSYKNVSEMLWNTNFSDIRLINPLWYQIIALIIVSTLLMLGAILSEIIWKKTKKWREKA